MSCMQFGYFMPTREFLGQGCIVQNQAEFAKWGKRALIVTGRNSARVSGALQDVCVALDQQNITWEIFFIVSSTLVITIFIITYIFLMFNH